MAAVPFRALERPWGVLSVAEPELVDIPAKRVTDLQFDESAPQIGTSFTVDSTVLPKAGACQTGFLSQLRLFVLWLRQQHNSVTEIKVGAQHTLGDGCSAEGGRSAFVDELDDFETEVERMVQQLKIGDLQIALGYELAPRWQRTPKRLKSLSKRMMRLRWQGL